MLLVSSVPILRNTLHSGSDVMPTAAVWQFKIMLDEARTVLKSKGLTDAEIANRIIEILDMKLCVGAERLDKASPMPHTISVANK